MPVDAQGLAPPRLFSASAGGVTYRSEYPPAAAFLPSGRALFCGAGFTIGDGDVKTSAWCLPYAAGEFGALLPAVPAGLTVPSYSFNQLVVAASPAEDKALVALYDNATYGADGPPNRAFVAAFDGEAFAPAAVVESANLYAPPEPAFGPGGEALFMYHALVTAPAAGVQTVITRVTDKLETLWSSPVMSNARAIEDVAFRPAPDGAGGLFALIGPSKVEDVVGLQAVWYDGASFSASAGGAGDALALLPRSRRAVAAGTKYGVSGEVYASTLTPDGETLAPLGFLPAEGKGFHQRFLGVLVSTVADRALVVTPRLRNGHNADVMLGADEDEPPTATASLFDGTAFTAGAPLGRCSHGGALGASGRFLLACADESLAAKLVP